MGAKVANGSIGCSKMKLSNQLGDWLPWQGKDENVKVVWSLGMNDM